MGTARDDIGAVEALHIRAEDAEILRILERRILGRFQFRGGFHQFAKGDALGAMDHKALVRFAGSFVHLPLGCRRGEEHFPGGGAHNAVGLEGAPGALAAAGDAQIAELRGGGRLMQADLGPVGFQFFGHGHGHAGADALPHVGFIGPDVDGAIPVDAKEGAGLEATPGLHGLGYSEAGTRLHGEREGDGKAGGVFNEIAARGHVRPPSRSRRYPQRPGGSRCGCADRCRSGRCSRPCLHQFGRRWDGDASSIAMRPA